MKCTWLEVLIVVVLVKCKNSSKNKKSTLACMFVEIAYRGVNCPYNCVLCDSDIKDNMHILLAND